MERDQFIAIAARISEGTASREEMALYVQYVDAFIESHPDWDLVDADLKKSIELEMREEIRKQIQEHGVVEEAVAIGVVVPLWKRFAVASRTSLGTRRVWLASAAAMAAITLGVWLYYASSTNGLFGGRHPELVSGSPLANDILPGKNTATLTLANGEVINLSDAKTGVVISEDKLMYNDGAALLGVTSKGGDPDLRQDDVVVKTPRGGTYQVVLPDGSKVWLNADSKISFPSKFTGAQRNITLEGEAYFQVAHNNAKPFIVKTDKQEVTVLGTHFNINAYPDEASTKTTLLEGSVSVSSLLTSSSLRGRTEESRSNLPGRGPSTTLRAATILKPNQQAVLTAGAAIQVKTINPEDIIDWKEGYIMFNSQPLEQIMAKLARWYNVDIVFEDEAVKKETFFGKVSRYENISKALTLLESTGVVRFVLKGNTVYVKRN